MNDHILVCPYCGGTQFVLGKQSGYAAIEGEGFLTSTTLYHDICLNCGSVARSYVRDPQKLLPRTERR